MIGRPESRRQLLLDTALRAAALLTLLAALLVLAARPELRLRFDATRTRAYSLSEQTERLLSGLQAGDWRIAVLLGDDTADAAVRGQIVEVLRRYEERGIAVRIIDPADPASAASYEDLLSELKALERERIERSERVIVHGLERLRELVLFAQEAAPQLQQLLALAEAQRSESQAATGGQDGAPATGGDVQLRSLDVLAAQGGEIIEAVERAYGLRELRPIPDYETARSILAAALGQYADEFDLIAEAIPGWLEPLGASAAPLIARERERYADFAVQLAGAADPLVHLDVPGLAAMADALERGDFAIVIGPQRAALVPPEQLFPQIQVDTGAAGTSFDRRFRGEQVLSAAIRSLQVETMPAVIFVHAEERSMFRVASDQRIDLIGARTLLESSRFAVREWIVGTGDRPVVQPNQPAVYIIMPPPERRGIEPGRRELMLIEQTRVLIEDGAAVMLNVWPSQLPRYRRLDPWAALSEPFGVRPVTEQVITELVDLGQGSRVYQQGQALERGADPHPIGTAVEGQQTFLVFPVPIAFREEAPVLSRTRLFDVEPTPRRWLEGNWTARMGPAEPGALPGEALPGPVTVAAASERLRPGEGAQRFILCGSGGWMHSYVLDAVTSFGGGRVALTNPGNQEFMLASVQWLSGMDDLIAPSPVSRQVSRLDGLSRSTAVRWAIFATVGVPGALLVMAALVFMVRRR